MVNQVQTTLAIEIIYYLVINSIKISILFFYLRIGKSLNLVENQSNIFSCTKEVRAPCQRHDILYRSILCCMCGLLSDTMYTSVQDVGLYWYGRRKVHQHDGTVLQ